MAVPVVVDASIVAAYFLREPEGSKFDSILMNVAGRKSELHVPSLFPYEIMNILSVSERRKRISSAQRDQILKEWEIIPLVVDDHPGLSVRRKIVKISQLYDLSAYDASYLELAIRLKSGLISLDKDLLKLKRKFSWIE